MWYKKWEEEEERRNFIADEFYISTTLSNHFKVKVYHHPLLSHSIIVDLVGGSV